MELKVKRLWLRGGTSYGNLPRVDTGDSQNGKIMTGAVFEENPFWKMALTRTSVKMGEPILEAFAGSYQYSGKR